MTRWGMLIDVDRCVGCQACTIACKTENQSPLDAWFAPVVEHEVGDYPAVRMAFLPTLCNQCEDAPCIQACPTGALHKRDDGIVLADQDTCIGSRACMAACPYGALNMFEDVGPTSATSVPERYAEQSYLKGTVSKCTYCAHRIDYGLEHGLTPGVDAAATPACVVTCPAECRIFGDLDNPESPISEYMAEHGPPIALRPDAETKPKTMYVGLP